MKIIERIKKDEKSNNFFTEESAIRTIDRYRICYIIIAITMFLITEFWRHLYRPFVYKNEINDYGLADSIGNLGGIIVQIYFTLAILNSPKKQGYRVIGLIVIGYTLYEIVQPYLPRGVFDWKDIYGNIIGGFISIFIWFTINKIIRNKVIHKF